MSPLQAVLQVLGAISPVLSVLLFCRASAGKVLPDHGLNIINRFSPCPSVFHLRVLRVTFCRVSTGKGLPDQGLAEHLKSFSPCPSVFHLLVLRVTFCRASAGKVLPDHGLNIINRFSPCPSVFHLRVLRVTFCRVSTGKGLPDQGLAEHLKSFSPCLLRVFTSVLSVLLF